MARHTTTRVPVDESYVALVGKAAYLFAYYERTIICIIELLRSGFVNEYSRGKAMTSGMVKEQFISTIDNLPATFQKVAVADLREVRGEFDRLIVKRNALIQAHPITDSDGSRILTYQTSATKPLPDMKWPKTQVESIIVAFDLAACQAGSILDRLR
jgi:hypothetical protein